MIVANVDGFIKTGLEAKIVVTVTASFLGNGNQLDCYNRSPILALLFNSFESVFFP